MKLLHKKRLTYATIGFYFLLGGVEYAVILPTVWLYLQHDFEAQPFMLGLVLSAFSFSALLSSPIFGSWSDKTGNTKTVILVCNLFSFCGSLMYSMGISAWFIVGSRFVAGLGAAVGSAIFADIARSTSVSERTGVMSFFMAIRQFGLLAGPGFNLFLRKLDFSIGPLKVNKYTAPGVFMACLWIVHEIMVVFLYWNLPALRKEECKSTIKEQISYSAVGSSNSFTTISSQSSNPPVFEEPRQSYPQESASVLAAEDEQTLSKPELRENNETQRDNACVFQVGSAPLLIDRGESIMSTSSSAIESVEKYMSQSPGYLQYADVYSKQDLAEEATGGHQQKDQVRRRSHDSRSFHSISSGNSSNNDLSHSPAELANIAFHNPVDNYGSVCNGDASQSQSHTAEDISFSSKTPRTKLTLRFLYTEYVREEVVVILATVFTAFFGQLVLETTCTPFTKKLLGWNELQNSILFCIAGVEILIVFVFISWLSKRLHDRYILLIGNILMVITLAFLTWFTPTATPENHTRTLAGFAFGIALDLVAIAFLAVIGTSLYSKVTGAENQGFSQGLRRVFSGLGTILGPLWAGSLIDHLYFMYGVCLALSVIVTLMLLVSFKHLKEKPPPEDSRNIQEEERPLLS